MYQFLSEEWIVAAREIRSRYQGELPEVPVSVRINQVITDVPFGDGTINAYVDTSNGSLELDVGELEEPDAVLVLDYETAKAMIVDRDPAIVMQAFMAGRMKVQGDMMKLMAMQAAVPEDERAEALAAEIQAITL
jgi:hypothetical protein